MSHSLPVPSPEGKGQCAPERTWEDLQKNFPSVVKGQEEDRKASEKKWSRKGEGRPMARGSARSWTPTFSSEMPRKQEELKLDSRKDILIGVKGP